jgi:lysophospholipase L1-like esterase
MKIKRILTVALCAFTIFAYGEPLRWRNARELTIEGQGWTSTKDPFDRFPASAEKIVRPAVWALSHDSAGICVRFISDASEITVRWVLRKESLAMPHMPASGVSGVDLYLKDKGTWHWVGAGRAKQFPTNEVSVVKNLKPGMHEFALYLPLYNGVRDVEVGVEPAAKLEPAARREENPIVFYGTSILQGGCASRPGMAYPSILGRRLDWPTINLGFSGNAWSEPEIAKLLAEMNPSVYVLDPLPNMSAELVEQRIEPMVKVIRAAHPKTPIILVEGLAYTDAGYVPPRQERFTTSNEQLRRAYKRLKRTEKDLFYISSTDLIGHDGEGTVDGTHPNDLGFLRMSEAIEPILRKAMAHRERIGSSVK